MIAYLQGRVIFKKEKFIIIDITGLGYKVFLSQRNLVQVKEGEQLKIFSFLYVRENALDLYGFLTWPELELFELINDIPGVGPKAALEISSLGPLETIKKAIERGDEKIFKGIHGIGPKKAKKILLEISGKIKEVKIETKELDDPAFQALISLGFKKEKIKEVLNKIDKDKPLEEKIKEALTIIKN